MTGAPSLAGLRVAVTGASGFCGSAVARAAAAAGADVVCLGRRPGPVGRHVRWDATLERPYLAGADAVVHLAAAVGDPPAGATAEAAFRAVNVDGTQRLLDAARDRPVVYVSSASVYASPSARGGPLREDAPIGGQRTAYGRTKAAGERLAGAAGAVVLRPRAVYGSGDPHLLPRLLRAVRGRIVALPGRDVPMSLTAVENLADACLHALAWPAGAYNIADEPVYRRDAVVRDVLAAHAVAARVAHVPAWLARAAAAVLAAVPVALPTAVAATVLPAAVRRPALTAYAVDQLAVGVVLDIGRATRQGWRPRRTLPDFLAALGRRPPPRS